MSQRLEDRGSTPREPDATPSKTRRKKDMHALQALGESLVALTPARLAEFGLPEQLAEAIAEARRISSFEGRRRQMQYIGRLMREVDPEPVAARLEAMRSPHHRETAQHQEAERWRDRLLADEAALAELASLEPGIDRKQLHTLVRTARRELQRGGPPKARRALFRALREALLHRSET